MMHGISEQDWIDYLAEQLEPDERDRVEAHLISCLTCWELYGQLAETTQTLREASEELQPCFPLKDEQLYARLHEFWTLVRSAAEHPQAANESLAAAETNPLRERLALLQALIARICGARTADNVLHAAARSSPARSLAEVTESNWLQFLARLTSITKTICGETVAYLVWESGQCSGREVVR